MVPRRGLEPPRVAPHEPESCVSTNFTTSAEAAALEAARVEAILSYYGARLSIVKNPEKRADLSESVSRPDRSNE